MGEPTALLRGRRGEPVQLLITHEQMRWARRRPAPDRTPLPRAGMRVGYRHWPGLDELVVEARVAEVDMDTQDDFNVWRFVLDERGVPVVVDGVRVMERVEDPWPSCLLETDFGLVQTREARIEGSPGWLPWRPEFASRRPASSPPPVRADRT